MTRHILFIAFFAATFTFCTRNDDCPLFQKESALEEIQLLSTVSIDGVLHLKYEYDARNRIAQIQWFNEKGEVEGAEIYTYFDDNDLVFVRYSNGETLSFEQSGNRIYKVKGTERSFYYSLDEQGLITAKHSRSSRSEHAFSSVFAYEYKGGNLVKTVSEQNFAYPDESFSIKDTATFVYDDKKSPFYYCQTPKWFLTINGMDIKNNLISCDIALRYAYTYNDSGFALTRTNILEGSAEEYTYINVTK